MCAIERKRTRIWRNFKLRFRVVANLSGSGFRQSIRRNSHEVFNSVFSGTDGDGVERVRPADCRDYACNGGRSSRARRPDRRHRIDRIDRSRRWCRSKRIHREYRGNRIDRGYRRNRIHGGYRGSRSARQDRWRHRGNRSGFASRALSSPYRRVGQVQRQCIHRACRQWWRRALALRAGCGAYPAGTSGSKLTERPPNTRTHEARTAVRL